LHFCSISDARAEKGGPANLGCTKKDVRNYERGCRKVISASDAQILIDIMKEKQRINSSFFFEYQLVRRQVEANTHFLG
jgi:hypothetical protein